MPRLFLLPVSTRRTLIYCERMQQQQLPNGAQPPISERIINRASQTWMSWEKAEKGWQKQITVYGNKLFRRIPFEEWGLKSLPPATKKRLEDVDRGNVKFECLFPGKFVQEAKVPEILRRLATERQRLHTRRMWTCIAWMPITVPFTLVPVIPNIPFFYLCFRAYSHYRALYGSRLLEHLTAKNAIRHTPSSQLDEAYAAGLLQPSQEASREAPKPSAADIERVAETVESQTQGGKNEVMLLQSWNGKLLAEGFDLPELEIEIERAVEQVEAALKNDEKVKKGQEEIQSSASKDNNESKR